MGQTHFCWKLIRQNRVTEPPPKTHQPSRTVSGPGFREREGNICMLESGKAPPEREGGISRQAASAELSPHQLALGGGRLLGWNTWHFAAALLLFCCKRNVLVLTRPPTRTDIRRPTGNYISGSNAHVKQNPLLNFGHIKFWLQDT